MSLLTELGDAFKALGEKISPTKDKLTPVSVSVYIGYTSRFLKAILPSLEDKATAAALNALLVEPGQKDQYQHSDEKAYAVMRSVFLPVLHQKAKTDPSGVFVDATKRAITSLDELSDKINKIIPATGVVASDDVKLSTALAFGYVEQTIEFGTWIWMLIGHSDIYASKSVNAAARYTYAYVSDHAEEVAGFINETMTSSGPTSVANRLIKLKDSAKDVSVTDQTGMAANYLDDNAFDNWEKSTAQGIIRNPVSMWYTFKENYRLNRIDTLRNRINWLNEHSSMLAMRNLGTDPNSAEYKRIQKAVNYYADLVEDYDRKIAELS